MSVFNDLESLIQTQKRKNFRAPYQARKVIVLLFLGKHATELGGNLENGRLVKKEMKKIRHSDGKKKRRSVRNHCIS